MVPKFVHHLVGQGAGFRHETDAARAGDVRGDDADVRAAGRDQARAVRADDPSLPALLGGCEELDRVMHGDALGDDHDELHLGGNRVEHGLLGMCWRHEHGRHVRASRLDGLRDSVMNGQRILLEDHRLPALAGRDTAHDAASRHDHPLRVFASFAAGHALHDDAARFIDEDCHVSSLRLRASRPRGRPRPSWT